MAAHTPSLNRRFARGLQAQASYTLAKALDNGVIEGRYVVGRSDSRAVSDPSNPGRDCSDTAWNTTRGEIPGLRSDIMRVGGWSRRPARDACP